MSSISQDPDHSQWGGITQKSKYYSDAPESNMVGCLILSLEWVAHIAYLKYRVKSNTICLSKHFPLC